MKSLIILIVTVLSTNTLAQSSGSMEDQIRAVSRAKIVNDRLQPLLNSNPNGLGKSDLFGYFGRNRCAIKMAEAVVTATRQFTVTTPCGDRYQIVVTGNLGDGDDGVTSAKIELQ